MKKHKPVSNRIREKYMRLLLSIASSQSTDIIKLHDPDLEKLRQHSDFSNVMRTLEGLGYVALICVNGSTRCKITPYGRSYFERKSDDVRSTIVKSVLVPIVVAIITTIATSIVLPSVSKLSAHWLSATQQWIQEYLPVSAPSNVPSVNQGTDPVTIESD